MERTYINEAQKAIGGTVKVQGFIENLRNSKYMAFIVLKDITGKLQITVEKADHPELVDTIDQLTPDSVITVTGKVVENDYVKMGGVEMIDGIHQIRVIFLFHRDLQFAGKILQHDEGHVFAVAQVLDKALHLDRAADGLLSLVDIGAFHNTGILL